MSAYQETIYILDGFFFSHSPTLFLIPPTWKFILIAVRCFFRCRRFTPIYFTVRPQMSLLTTPFSFRPIPPYSFHIMHAKCPSTFLGAKWNIKSTTTVWQKRPRRHCKKYAHNSYEFITFLLKNKTKTERKTIWTQWCYKHVEQQEKTEVIANTR